MDNPLPIRIFVIEDDRDTCDNLQDILELDQHIVLIANSAQQALLNQELSNASVILLDWKLPDATALQLLPQLKKIAPETDVIIITGHGDFDQAVTALREGAADYLLKPINPEALRGGLERISHRRWLAQEKNRSEAMFRNLVQAAPCLIVILRQDLSISYFSNFAEQLTGYRQSDVLGHNFIELFLPEFSSTGAAPTINNIFSQQFSQSHQSAIRCADGTHHWLVWNTQILDDVDGATGILAVGQDVTEARRATEKLVQSERLSAIGEAMTGLAHESRNALQRSQAFLELLAVEVAGQTEALRLVDRIQQAQNHLHQLYEEVRQYAAPVRLERRSYVAVELVEETWAYLTHVRQGRQTQLQVHGEAQDLTADVDRFMIQQVFRNILENSLAACADPVEIVLTCSERQDAGQKLLQISLRDNGPGLSPEQRERIFDPFYTTKTRGTGLGMTLCKRIIEAHGGAISIGDSSGTEILIELPVRQN